MTRGHYSHLEKDHPCEDAPQSPRFSSFLRDLEDVCRKHKVVLSTSGYDGLQVWDADVSGYPIYCAGIEDMTC